MNRFVEQEDTKEIIDIKALNAEISQIVQKQSALRNSLSVNRFVEQEDTKEIIDIKALNAEISQIVQKQSALRNSLESIIKELEEGQNA
ncbi:hypothetical protein AOH416_14080 [Helicobacter pylori]